MKLHSEKRIQGEKGQEWVKRQRLSAQRRISLSPNTFIGKREQAVLPEERAGCGVGSAVGRLRKNFLTFRQVSQPKAVSSLPQDLLKLEALGQVSVRDDPTAAEAGGV